MLGGSVDDATATLPDPTKSLPGNEGGNTIGKADFLNLLVAQLKHQDPMNPMSGTDFTAQLAQFTSLEQLINISESLKTLGNLEKALNRSQGVSMLGKQVLASGNAIVISDGKVPSFGFSLPSASDQTTINVFSEAGEIVSLVEVGQLSAGLQSIPFSGLDLQGASLPNGNYTFIVQAVSAEGEAIVVQPFSSGIVSAVSIADGLTQLTVGNSKVQLSDVLAVSEAPSAPVEEPPAQ